MRIEEDDNYLVLVEVPKEMFLKPKEHFQSTVNGAKLAFINSKDKLVFYRKPT